MRNQYVALVCCALSWMLGGCSSEAGSGTAQDQQLRMNEIQVLGTHNSYHIQPRDSILEALAIFDSQETADSLEYTAAVRTANGVVRQAPVILDQIRVAGFEINNVQASVSRSGLGISLLGNSFLRRLQGYQVEDGNLILRW